LMREKGVLPSEIKLYPAMPVDVDPTLN